MIHSFARGVSLYIRLYLLALFLGACIGILAHVQ
jgi:hypothetical protein